MKTKYLEINLKTKQHLAFEFLPYGFGYEKPLLIIKLFIISFYIKFPFKIAEKNTDISYGFSFNDYDHRHWFPDYLHLDFGKYTKSYDMPWFPVLFEIKYETKKIKDAINIKDLDNFNLLKYNIKIDTKTNGLISAKVYREIRILKCKVFGRFIELGKKEIHVLNIDYDKPNTDLSERGIVSDMIFLDKDESNSDGFKRYCQENRIELHRIIYNELLDL